MGVHHPLPALDVPPVTRIVAFEDAQLFRRTDDPTSIIIVGQSASALQSIQASAHDIQRQVLAFFPDVSISYTTIPPS